MNLAPLLAAGLLAAASVQRPDAPRADLAPPAAATPAAVPARPAVGALAPDFLYESKEYLWQSLHNMLEQGDVLLVFAPGDDVLLALERDRETLLRAGIVPVAVVGRHESDVWHAVTRLDLGYSLLSDPRNAIAEQFGALDPATRAPAPAWFVVDRARRVRASGTALAGVHDWTALAARALGRSDVHTAGAR